MALSNNAQRALEQVKNGLLVLYGADYFTDEDWYKVDHLIHQGQYVFTRGPSTVGEPVPASDESKTGTSLTIDVCNGGKKDKTLVVEKTEPASSHMADFSTSNSDTPTSSSGENSADEESPTYPSPNASLSSALSESTSPLLPTGYTQAQLEESKAFRSEVMNKVQTQPEQPAYGVEKPTFYSPSLVTTSRSSSWASEVDEAEAMGRLQLSVSTLDLYREPAESSTPKLTKKHLYDQFVKIHNRKPKDETDYWQPNNPEFKGLNPTPSPKYSRSVTSATSSPSRKSVKSTRLNLGAAYVATRSQKEGVGQLGVKTGDRVDVVKFVSDSKYVCQNLRTKYRGQYDANWLEPFAAPKNSRGSPWPVQQNSTNPSEDNTPDVLNTVEQIICESGKSLGVNGLSEEEPVTAQSGHPVLEATALLEQQKSEKQSEPLMLEQLGEVANFSETPNDSSELLSEKVSKIVVSNSDVKPSVDMIESWNAAEWDEEPGSRPKVPSWTAPEQLPKPEQGQDTAWEPVATRGKRAMPLRPAGARPASRPAPANPPITSSRFSILSDEKETDVTPAMQAAIDRGIRKILNNEMNQIRQTLRPPTKPKVFNKKSRKDPSDNPTIIPKTNACWYWATGKGCRFTEDECRDLHTYEGAVAEPTNYRNGMPTWGALADYIGPEAPVADEVVDGKDQNLTCWFWAEKGKCMHSDADCKFSHKHMPGGVAKRKQWKQWKQWKQPDGGEPWRRVSEPGVGGVNGTWEDADSSTIPMSASGGDWGEVMEAHVTPLENRSKQEEVGW